VPIGLAAVRRPGHDVTIVTYGAMLWTVLAAAELLAEEGVEAEVIDLP
jgi:pyruvate/2-oxoglutarate/acetoin dehydrogenase E1 component